MESLDVVKLLKAAQNLERNISVSLMYSGLRVPQYRLLDALEQMGQATVTEMSERLNVRRATASVLINELIAAGIVEVTENNSDRRSFHIRLTRMGQGKLEAARYARAPRLSARPRSRAWRTRRRHPAPFRKWTGRTR